MTQFALRKNRRNQLHTALCTRHEMKRYRQKAWRLGVQNDEVCRALGEIPLSWECAGKLVF